MKKLLSALAVPKLRPGEYWDALIPGLALRVGARRRTWTLRHRVGGRHRRDILGYFPGMSLADARTAAGKLIERVEAGATVLPAPVHPRGALTLGALIDRYEVLRQREGYRTKTLPRRMHALRGGLADYLGLPLVQFTKADLRAARDVVTERAPVAANRLVDYLGSVFQWAAEEDLIEHNFTRDIRRSPERKRDRVLTSKELVAIWSAAEHMNGTVGATAYGRLVRFLLVTAQRRSEGASLKHGDILDGRWKQTANKSDRPHSLTLPPLAMQLVGRGEPSEPVFAGVVAFSRHKVALDAASGVSGWRLHDLRRTAASRMQELGIRNEIVQAVLNHAVPGVGGVYLRAELEPGKAEALRLWAAELTRLAGKTRRAVS